MNRVFGVLFISMVLSGCSSMSKEQCQTADWKAYGYQDGAKGKPVTNYDSYARTCNDYGIKSDFEQYLVGHKQGVVLFCTYESGYQAGTRNYKYQGICKDNDEPSFLEGLAKGKKLYQAQQELRRENAEINRLERLLDTKQKQIEINEELIIDDGTTPDKRRQLLEENKVLEVEVYEIDARLHQAMERAEALSEKVDRLIQRGSK